MRKVGWVKMREVGSAETWGNPERTETFAGNICDREGGLEAVVASGETREEAESHMTEALASHLASLRARGQPVPEPYNEAGRIRA